MTSRNLLQISINILHSSSGQRIIVRSFFKLPIVPNAFSLPVGTPNASTRTDLHQRAILGYRIEELFDVVNDVQSYEQFLPWCRSSRVVRTECPRGPALSSPKLASGFPCDPLSRGGFPCDLTIGFGPLLETYRSYVRFVRPRIVTSDSVDTRLFRHLHTVWRFAPVPSEVLIHQKGTSKRSDTRDSLDCVTLVDFYVSFEFRSALHAAVSSAFLEVVGRQQLDAFLSRVAQLHGAQSPLPAALKPLASVRTLPTGPSASATASARSSSTASSSPAEKQSRSQAALWRTLERVLYEVPLPLDDHSGHSAPAAHS